MQYQPPLNDLNFVLFDVLGIDQLQTLGKYAEASPDIISAVMEEAGKLAAEVLQPVNKIGDQQGCTYDAETHSVKKPDGSAMVLYWTCTILLQTLQQLVYSK